ncbi:DUF6705 family protein [Chryseobacterium sp. HMWF035]|uniref:DUF6705 family protein n=1 Tax=Chryseobacterium sp. HMWF035 TaxID=2056868 RepID=UPI000D57FD6A|nr:DUF6705 family protein [Chryseobacterium sp. HMWF035]PVV51205.1 hypothetical protein DD829_20510 [Chryseobacterium sp. HMWF035]
MKKIFIIALLNFLFINCKSQSQIINILDDDGTSKADTYYKDINNLLNPYTGTWVYDNGNRYIKLVLIKKIKFYNSKYYEDVIIGGVEYKENNITKTNTISFINNTYGNSIKYPLSGNILLKNDFPPICLDCFPNELRLGLNYHDLNPDTSFGTIILRKITINGQDAIKLKLTAKTVYQKAGSPPPLDFKLPVGEYIFIKQ